MKLRPPNDKLADCVWLPRFIDKTRCHLAGTLDPEFVRPFGHALATDGVFLEHFGIRIEEILEAIAGSKGNDQEVEVWFAGRDKYTPELVAAWNELAPNLGKAGYPVRVGFLWVLKRYYGGVAPDPRVQSAFTAIEFDEGFLAER